MSASPGGPGLISRVAVIVAMQEEAAPLIEHLKLVRSEGIAGAPTIVHSGSYKGGTVSVVNPGRDEKTGVNLIGTDAAALTTFLAIKELLPDLVVTAGTCGGFKRAGGKVGDVYLATAFQHHDRRIPIPGYDAFGLGRRDAAKSSKLAEKLGFKTGLCSTGNSLDFIKDDDLRMADAVVKDMEGAAVAWAADLAGNVPVLGIKVVTDLVDGGKPTQDEFLANLSAASHSLQDALPRVLDAIIMNDLDSLQ